MAATQLIRFGAFHPAASSARSYARNKLFVQLEVDGDVHGDTDQSVSTHELPFLERQPMPAGGVIQHTKICHHF